MPEYLLPEGNVLISFSGGRTSGYMLHKILEENGGLPDRCKVVFANTGREMPQTLDFVHECGDRWNVPIKWLEYDRIDNKVTFKEVSHNSAARNGEPFETLLYKPYLPNAVARFCTAELKVRTIKRYLVSQKWKHWHSGIGIRADEPRRINRGDSRDRWTFWYPLADAGATKATVMGFWKQQPFDLRLFGPNGVTAKGNCDGCFLKSEATLAMMWREHPDRMEWWSAMEKKIGGTFHKRRSYDDVGNFVKRQGDWIFNEEVGALCQEDDGECTG
jgi:3'-phosphoadenosine 5'-phosphosulfate sulfotransferase (PAPS reductase)/FAD synthetase